MKKIFVLCLMAITMCINVNAHNSHRCMDSLIDYPIGCNIGACYYKHGVPGICCGVEGMGMTFEYAFAGTYKVDNQYDNGGLSDDYRMQSYLIGHIRYFHCRRNTYITLNPKVGLCVESRLYNYKHNNSDVAYNNYYLEGGLDFVVNINSFLYVKVGASNMKLNAQIAISF